MRVEIFTASVLAVADRASSCYTVRTTAYTSTPKSGVQECTPDDVVLHEGGHDGCHVQGKQAVAQETEALEEADITPQQDHIHCQHDCPRCAHPEHHLHAPCQLSALQYFAVWVGRYVLRATLQ